MEQKYIKVGSSLAVTIPSSLVKKWGIQPGKETSVVEGQNGDFVIKNSSTGNPNIQETVARATAYIEKYRKDFEALADK